jgi:hypothetical protein
MYRLPHGVSPVLCELLKIEVYVDGRYTGNAVLTEEDKGH